MPARRGAGAGGPTRHLDAGGLNVARLLAAFQDFFRLHSEHWIERCQHREAGPQLLQQAVVQRIANRAGAESEREYGLGRLADRSSADRLAGGRGFRRTPQDGDRMQAAVP